MVYAREIDGETLTFGDAGKVLRNALVVYDHQTQSQWSQFIGEAVTGSYQGTALDLIPSQITTWLAWKSNHPDTLAIQKDKVLAFDMNQIYYGSSMAGLTGEAIQDTRLPAKEHVIGLANGEDVMAYPFSIFEDEPVVNHSLGDTDVLIAFDSASGTASIFDRYVDGKTLRFKDVGLQEEGYLVIQDTDTDTIWHALGGRAISGTLSGTTLNKLPGHMTYWFSWKDYYPKTKVYGQ
jgi:hypothetical protein